MKLPQLQRNRAIFSLKFLNNIFAFLFELKKRFCLKKGIFHLSKHFKIGLNEKKILSKHILSNDR